MTMHLVNKHLRHRDCDDNYDTHISYHYVNDSLLESRRERSKPKKLPVTRIIKCVASYNSTTITPMITAARKGIEPSDPLELYEISISSYNNQGQYRDVLISPITKEDFDFMCDCNYFTVTIEYSVKNNRMPPMTYTIYGHSQHTIGRDLYIDRSKVDIMVMGLSPEHSGMGYDYVIDYDGDGEVDYNDDGPLAALAPVSIMCSNRETAALKARWPDTMSENNGNELYYITNRNHPIVFSYGNGMIHSITIVATRDTSIPNYTANLHMEGGPRYFVGPWSKQ